jgi:hypothetical protein
MENSDASSRAEREAMRTLNDWVDSMQPKFSAVEMQDLKRRLTAAFRAYEERIEAYEKAAKGILREVFSCSCRGFHTDPYCPVHGLKRGRS